MARDDEDQGKRVDHPNRRKASSKATKTVVLLLLAATMVLVVIISIGGWSTLESTKYFQIIFVLVYMVMALQVLRWSRGVLPMAAAAAILVGIFAAISGPQWFDRTKTGFAESVIPASAMGLVTLILVPVQVLLIAFALRGFQQGWNVEIEVRDDEDEDEDREQSRGRGEPATA